MPNQFVAGLNTSVPGAVNALCRLSAGETLVPSTYSSLSRCSGSALLYVVFVSTSVSLLRTLTAADIRIFVGGYGIRDRHGVVVDLINRNRNAGRNLRFSVGAEVFKRVGAL